MYKILLIILFALMAFKELVPLLKDKLYKDAGVTAGLILVGFVICMIAAFQFRFPL